MSFALFISFRCFISSLHLHSCIFIISVYSSTHTDCWRIYAFVLFFFRLQTQSKINLTLPGNAFFCLPKRIFVFVLLSFDDLKPIIWAAEKNIFVKFEVITRNFVYKIDTRRGWTTFYWFPNVFFSSALLYCNFSSWVEATV